MNVILQTLINLKPFCNRLFDIEECSPRMSILINLIENSFSEELDLKNIAEAFKWKSLDYNNQQDAGEFFTNFLDFLSFDLNESERFKYTINF